MSEITIKTQSEVQRLAQFELSRVRREINALENELNHIRAIRTMAFDKADKDNPVETAGAFEVLNLSRTVARQYIKHLNNLHGVAKLLKSLTKSGKPKTYKGKGSRYAEAQRLQNS